MVGAQCVDHQAYLAIAGVVGKLLGFCWVEKNVLLKLQILFYYYFMRIFFTSTPVLSPLI